MAARLCYKPHEEVQFHPAVFQSPSVATALVNPTVAAGIGKASSGANSATSSSSHPRKRPSRAGTRRVSSLPPDQLKRKRENDREAQRVIRRRTKEKIERLEYTVSELTSANDWVQKLKIADERIRSLEAENRMLKARLPNGQFGGVYEGAHFRDDMGMRPPIGNGGFGVSTQPPSDSSLPAAPRHDSGSFSLHTPSHWQAGAASFNCLPSAGRGRHS